LTLLYSALFLASGAALLAITYTVVRQDALNLKPVNFKTLVVRGATAVPPLQGTLTHLAPGRVAQFNQITSNTPLSRRVRHLLGTAAGRAVVSVAGYSQRLADVHQLLVVSAIALAIMAIISGLLGWLMAGRVLRPVRTMTVAARAISAANLDQRLAMEGPRDELRQLADTIDGLLERLERAFAAQRQFVANASHELRTPITAVRALLELVLSDPRATVSSFRSVCHQVLEETDQQEQLIDALLTLAQGQRGLDRRESFDLADTVAALLPAYREQALARGLAFDASVAPAPVAGDSRLVSRLAANLLDNGLRHNVPGGKLSISVGMRAGEAVLAVLNTGPVITPEQAPGLLEPFRRLGAARTGHGQGLGLGLSIVGAIAGAHAAELQLSPRPTGGLTVEVRFPAAAPVLPPAPALDPVVA
jgi:signal transduction histidine kinase